MIISGTNTLFGGTQNRIQSTEIKDNAHLVPFRNRNALNVGDTKHMIFNDNGNVPFWKNELKRIETKHDQDLGLKFK